MFMSTVVKCCFPILKVEWCMQFFLFLSKLQPLHIKQQSSNIHQNILRNLSITTQITHLSLFSLHEMKHQVNWIKIFPAGRNTRNTERYKSTRCVWVRRISNCKIAMFVSFCKACDCPQIPTLPVLCLWQGK